MAEMQFAAGGGDQAARGILRGLFDTALAAIAPAKCLPAHLPPHSPHARTCIVAMGKAAAEMAAVACDFYGHACHGLVVTRYGHGVAAKRLPPGIEVIEAGHPVPDRASLQAAERAMVLASELKDGDQLIALVSGGGSALMAAPAPGVTLADKQALTRDLLRSGATISEINCVRKRLSRVKGGRLAIAAAPARVFTAMISDIPGDDPAFIASGPTIADRGSLAQARAIIARHGLEPPASIMAALNDPANETPSPGLPGLLDGKSVIVAAARDAFAAAGAAARAQGLRVCDLGDRLEAEARLLGAEHARLARSLHGDGGARQLVLSGGEASVTVRGTGGRGGRNLEYLLSLAVHLDGAPGISAIACDTDGIDGTEDAAGAIVTPDTLARGTSLGLDARDHLARNDAWSYFAALGDLVVTGPTRTNVNDFRAILIEGGA